MSEVATEGRNNVHIPSPKQVLFRHQQQTCVFWICFVENSLFYPSSDFFFFLQKIGDLGFIWGVHLPFLINQKASQVL